MKKIILFLGTAIIISTSFVSKNAIKAGIIGTIDPPDGVKRVWAISGHDSLSTVPVMGKFSIEVKPGTWKVSVEAVDANKNTAVDNVLVQDNQFTDVGVIKLPS